MTCITRYRLVLALSFALPFSLVSVGCTDAGACADPAESCGINTRFDPVGRMCIADQCMSGGNPSDACGNNTSFDTTSMTCIGTLTCEAPATYCGANTTYDGATMRCLGAFLCPTPSSFCGTATTFDVASTTCRGSCAAPADSCGPGTYFDTTSQRCLPGTLTVTPTTTFANGTDGWSVVDLVGSTMSPAEYATVLAPLDITWNPTGGVDNGPYISRRDVTSNVYFFQASPVFLGDQSAFRLGTLDFAMKSDASNYTTDAFVVLIGDGGKVAVAPIAVPTSAWTSYSVAFDVSAVAWRADNAAGALLSQSDLDALLADVEALRINAEWGATVTETTGIDEVKLVLP